MRPNTFFAGLPRSGTTSLYHYFSQHPEICVGREKEPNYFSWRVEGDVSGPGAALINRRVVRDLRQYERLWRDRRNETCVVDFSVRNAGVGVAALLDEYSPGCRFLVQIRNPVDRVYSRWCAAKRDGWETSDSVVEAVIGPDRRTGLENPRGHVRDMIGSAGVQHILDTVGRPRVLLSKFDDFAADPGASLKRMFRFLEVDPETVIDTSVRHNRGGMSTRPRLDALFVKAAPLRRAVRPMLPRAFRDRMYVGLRSTFVKPKLSPADRAALTEYYLPEIEALERVTEFDLSAWKIGDDATR